MHFVFVEIGGVDAMSIRHEKFVESIRLIINEDESPSKSLSTGSDDESNIDSFDLQEELERRFDDTFGPLDDDD